MADILKVYTGDQLYEMFKQYLIAANVGLTDFNDGSKTKALIQSCADIVSVVSMDLKEAIFQAIPVSLYEGFGFPRKAAAGATGFIRPYRIPQMWVKYVGTGTSATITITPTQIQAACIGAPGDAFTRLFSASPKTSDLVSYIDGLSGWEATLISDVQCSTLYQYSAVNAIAQKNYLNNVGMDFMLQSDIAITIIAGYSVTIDSMQIITNTTMTVPAGVSGVQCPAINTTTGPSGNIIASAIDTANGKGMINSSITGISAVRNDSAFSGGVDAETDEARKIRFIDSVNALNAGTKNGIIVALEGVSTVRSVNMLTGNPYRGMNTIIVDDGTGTISLALLTALEKVLYGDPNDLDNFPGKNAEGIGYQFIAPTVVSVSIGVTAYRLSSTKVNISEIELDIQSAIEQYVNTLAIGRDVILSEVVRVGKNSNSAIYDLIITSPASNVVVDTVHVARTGSGTGGNVTVTVSIASSE